MPTTVQKHVLSQLNHPHAYAHPSINKKCASLISLMEYPVSMCNIVFAHQSEPLIQTQRSTDHLQRPQTNSLKCQVCCRVNTPKLEQNQIDEAVCSFHAVSRGQTGVNKQTRLSEMTQGSL